MKKLVLLVLAVGALSVRAQAVEVIKGYVNLDHKGRPHLVTVDLEERELTSALPLDFFSKAQQTQMVACMKKKTTHAITVEVHPATQQGVPTGIPGRTTTTHFPEYKNVRCIPAPGFLEEWREIVRRSRFR